MVLVSFLEPNVPPRKMSSGNIFGSDFECVLPNQQSDFCQFGSSDITRYLAMNVKHKTKQQQTFNPLFRFLSLLQL